MVMGFHSFDDETEQVDADDDSDLKLDITEVEEQETAAIVEAEDADDVQTFAAEDSRTSWQTDLDVCASVLRKRGWIVYLGVDDDSDEGETAFVLKAQRTPTLERLCENLILLLHAFQDQPKLWPRVDAAYGVYARAYANAPGTKYQREDLYPPLSFVQRIRQIRMDHDIDRAESFVVEDVHTSFERRKNETRARRVRLPFPNSPAEEPEQLELPLDPK